MKVRLPRLFFKLKFRQNGQILVIVLLVLAVVLTISLSVISRSLVDVEISQHQEESARAFSVAEAGLEEALEEGTAISGYTVMTEWGGVQAEVVRADLGGSDVFDFGNQHFKAGEVQTVWLRDHDGDGDIIETGVSPFNTRWDVSLCWGDGESAALEATVFYLDQTALPGQNFRVIRANFDPDSTRSNGFDLPQLMPPSPGDACEDFDYKSTLDFDGDYNLSIIPGRANLYAIRLKFIYNTTPQPLRVVASGTPGTPQFPNQGYCYESTATIRESGITRRVRQCEFYKAPLGIFDYVLFSDQNLSK